MPAMTMRERILAVIQGREHDRVPFVMYDCVLPIQEVRRLLGPHQLGLFRWGGVHRVEHPHCRIVTEEYEAGGTRCQRMTLHTPAGSIFEERAFEPTYGTSSIRKHYVEEPQDYAVLWSYLEDCVLLPDYERYVRDQAELGDSGMPLAVVERTPYQQLWVEWVGLEALAYHMADYPDLVGRTMGMLQERNRKIFEIAYYSPAPFIDVPDNITALTIGPARFRSHCVSQYDELADMLAERGAHVAVHMDGDLKPLAQAIAESRVRAIESFTPAPDNDTTVAEAVSFWAGKALLVNFPSSVHLLSSEEIRAETESILASAGHSGQLQIQVSENVPCAVWRNSLPAISEVVEAFGAP